MTDEINNLSGYILESPSQALEKHHLVGCRQLSFHGMVGQTKWEQFTYACPTPFRHEDPTQLKPPYLYRLIVRRSGQRLLLLSLNNRIIDHLAEQVLRPCFRPPLRHVPIGVDALVKALVAKPTTYALSFAHARVPAFGVSLRSISYYGDDLAEASLFRENISLTNFFTCGLRLAVGGSELVRLGSDGMISFYHRDDRSILEVEKALGFLRHNGYLAPDIPNQKPKT